MGALKRVLAGGLVGGLGGRLGLGDGGGHQRGLQRRLQTGLGRGLVVKLRSAHVQGPGLVQVWFGLQLKFNSLELDSEVE